ncbi:MAG: hypothetical protein Q7P63_02190 [Verrucomicrobiota bacterium JB022]|nr:hypothetical protein [Verrucomicrobiota bacterium JB022]
MVPIGTLLQVWLWWTLLLLGPEAAHAELSSAQGPILLPGASDTAACVARQATCSELGTASSKTAEDDWFVAGGDDVSPAQRPTWAALPAQPSTFLDGSHRWLTDWHKRACPIVGPPHAA